MARNYFTVLYSSHHRFISAKELKGGGPERFIHRKRKTSQVGTFRLISQISWKHFCPSYEYIANFLLFGNWTNLNPVQNNFIMYRIVKNGKNFVQKYMAGGRWAKFRWCFCSCRRGDEWLGFYATWAGFD